MAWALLGRARERTENHFGVNGEFAESKGARGEWRGLSFDLGGSHFFSKTSDMGNGKNYWWRNVPWGWVSVTAYVTALVCVAASQIMEPGGAIGFIRDYQTLLAGLATMAALLIAAEQLRRQSARDTVDAVRHYEAELDAMRDLGHATAKIWNGADAVSRIPVDTAWWERLRQETNVSLGPALARLSSAVEQYNALFDWPDQPFLSLHGVDAQQVREAQIDIQRACLSLKAEVEKRRSIVLQIIEAAA